MSNHAVAAWFDTPGGECDPRVAVEPLMGSRRTQLIQFPKV